MGKSVSAIINGFNRNSSLNTHTLCVCVSNGRRFGLVLGGVVREYVSEADVQMMKPYRVSCRGDIIGAACALSGKYELTSVVQRNAAIGFIDVDVLMDELSSLPVLSAEVQSHHNCVAFPSKTFTIIQW